VAKGDAVTALTGGLAALGWDERLDAVLASEAVGLVPARVLTEERGLYVVAGADGEASASASGRLRFDAELDPSAAWPAVGDWVALEPGDGDHRLIARVLPRRTAVIRRSPGDRRMPAQVLAANVDIVFVVTSMNGDFNLRRLERYLAVAWESGATPVILLSKADLAGDADSFRVATASIAPGVDVIAVSAVTGAGLDLVRGHLGPGRTVVFTGSSGVGKSSIVNALAGEHLLDTAGVREDDARGRHTTTRRQLIRLEAGLLIDTPGLRELGVLDGDGLAVAFDDVESLTFECRFNDCRHQSEPGCAVRSAIGDGRLSAERFDAYTKLQREARRAVMATDALARKAERRRWTAISRSVEVHMRTKYGAER
jgi:ribosome biogenesis GTPase / thiamine phosphate phosphatase